MTILKVFLMRHPVSTYFILTFAISWGGVLLVIGGPGGIPGTTEQFQRLLPMAIVAMLAGPSVASLLMTGLVDGKAGFRTVLARLLRWRVGMRWYAVALLSAPLVFAVVHSALALTSPVFLPGILTTHDKASLLLFGVTSSLLVGFLEEFGWTGFAIPHLRLRYGVLATGLLVGVPWGAWHLLTNNFWIGGTYAAGISIALFLIVNGASLLVGQLLAYRVLMVWVYDQTESLFVAILMHASFAACTFIFGPSAVGVASLIYGFALAAAWWLVVAAVAVTNRGHLARQPLQRRLA